jgi:antitoxin HigA-1
MAKKTTAGKGRRPRKPTHPGEVMLEVLEALDIDKTAAARRMKISRPTLYDVLNGAAGVTADFALRFATLAGTTPDLYLHMQAELDLWEARGRLKDTLASIEPAPAKASG